MGCGCSKSFCCTRKPNNPVKRKSPKPPENIVEDFVIVWLNPTADSDPDTLKTEEQLQELVNVVLTYTDPEECHAFIDGIKNDEKVFLVVSGAAIGQFTPSLQEASHIDSMYYFTSERKARKIRFGKIPGVDGLFTSVEALREQMKKDLKIGQHNLVKPQVVEMEPERISFMYDQLCKEIILTSNEEDLEGLYQFCEKKYSGNKNAEKYINDLKKTYSKEDSIQWYTKEGCLYKILNNALRTRKHKNLYELRVFARHLHQQIANQLEKTEREIPTLYRGQLMDATEFNRIRSSKEKLLFFPNFLSTSINYDQAVKFMTRAFQKFGNQEKIKVLLEIQVDKEICFPFTDVSGSSEHPEEQEWLFSMGSVFHIDAIQSQPDQIQLIKLTLMNYRNEKLQMLKEHIQNFVKDENICLSFARLIHQLADWKESAKFYKKSLDKEKESYRKAAILNNLGSVVSQLGDHDKALDYYNQSLQFDQEEENSDRKELASTYNNIGTLYYKKKEMDLAIENFRKAIGAYNDAPTANQEIVATIYNNIAHVLNHQGKYRKALVNNERCMRIRERILPPLHPGLATAHNSMANTYYYLYLLSQGKEPASQVTEYAEKALDYAKKACDIDNQALPSDHPQTKIHTENRERFIRELRNLKQYKLQC